MNQARVVRLARRALGWLTAALAFAATTAFAAEPSFAQRLGDLVNVYRTEHGLPALHVDATLSELAKEHSAAMAKAGKMSHDDFPSRVRRSGRAMCVENVGWNYHTAQRQFDAWRESSGHNRNMLDRRVDRLGVGVAGDYVTLMACGA